MMYLLVELLPARLRPKAKAVIGGALSGLVPLILAGLLLGAWDKAALVAALTALVVGPAVYAAPNLPARKLRPAEAGLTVVELCLIVLAIVAVLLLLGVGMDIDVRGG
jgi:hypothetical protein